MAGAAGPWDGLRVLVTAGGTREPIDSVRFIGNRSSGRMGMALAAAARAKGADVTVIAANVSLPAPGGVHLIEVETAAELAAAAGREFPGSDVLLMAAAVADYAPADPSTEKITREQGGLELHLRATEDVIAELSRSRKPGQTLVGFAAEHGAGAVGRAREKLARKGVDAVVLNDISRSDIGFDSEENEVTIVEANGETHLERAPKEHVAAAILERVDLLRAARERDPSGT
jgi:phosphopantothenoylcysteine decarboxylase/phosphopantothenate--cysteine ligase